MARRGRADGPEKPSVWEGSPSQVGQWLCVGQALAEGGFSVVQGRCSSLSPLLRDPQVSAVVSSVLGCNWCLSLGLFIYESSVSLLLCNGSAGSTSRTPGHDPGIGYPGIGLSP